MISASLPPFRERVGFFLMVVFKTLCGVGMFLGTVGDVLCGPVKKKQEHLAAFIVKVAFKPLERTVR